MSKYVPPFKRRNNEINSNTTSVPNRTNTYNPIHSTNINYNVPITNNRWSLDRNPTETSSSYRINYSNPINSKGFHGFIVPSGLIENSLFKNNIYTNELIDFERVFIYLFSIMKFQLKYLVMIFQNQLINLMLKVYVQN